MKKTTRGCLLLCLATLLLSSCAPRSLSASQPASEASSVSSSSASASSAIVEEMVYIAPREASEKEAASEKPAAQSGPTVRFSAEKVALGETIVIYVENAAGEKVTATTDLSRKPVFYDQGESQMALLPVSYYTAPGVYSLQINVGSQQFQYDIQADSREFEVQNLTVDESTTQDTINSNAANQEWNQKIEPLKYITDSEKYWDGNFLMPVAGEWTTPFGTIRYTNGSTTAARHGAIDIAASAGTPVPAANTGRVIFAQFIQMSGNTVVIEHGLGLKTWYFHMNEIDIQEGDMVQKGDIIGKVGSTGFSTGAHLHFGMSVNEVYINPETAVKFGIG